ncbi:type II toxin-antitoxin system death-on-curing family toxin [Streptoalloteichus hindustanus]|uniref:Death on curing protein n=1 Tax=Streptoalloteichus hindustanus TaxID=2017 RepID=A0A1M5AMZ2_STRHI|nr:Fic family protein [Streptoalloteichus hindustanus]SHF31640.1 death on curing protein [Streptoalloteichus hindustanus]
MSGDPRYPTLDDAVALATAFLGEPPEVRDWGMLQAALDRPRTTLFGADAYPELADKAGALLHSLARNHPLIDGNKRLAWISVKYLVRLNGHNIHLPSTDDGYDLVISAAEGTADAAGLSRTIGGWMRPLPQR